MGLIFKRQGKLSLELYIDFDFTRSFEDYKSTTCYYSFLMGNQIMWWSKKQEVVS